jgi:hypothetical protein
MRILLLTAAVALGNAAPFVLVPPQTTTSVIAVTIDAVVVDAAGRAIPGLAAADFKVELDGQSRRVVAVTYFPSGPPMAGAVGPAFDAVTTAPPAYRIVVQPPDGTSAGQAFAVTVTVSRPGAKVQAPARAAAAPVTVTGTRPAAASSERKSPEDRLRAAISGGRTELGLPIQIGRAVRRGRDSASLIMDVQIEIPASASPPLSGLLGLVDPRGATRSASPQIERTAGGRHRVDLSLPLDPGAYRLRFAAIDAAGTLGAIETAVTAQLTTMGPLLASDLLRWTIDANGRRPFLLEEVPADAATIGATLELYATSGAAPPNDLLVKMELAETGPSASTLIERIVTPEARDGTLVADAEFPLARVVKGAYLLRASVMSGATRLGTVSATLIRP